MWVCWIRCCLKWIYKIIWGVSISMKYLTHFFAFPLTDYADKLTWSNFWYLRYNDDRLSFHSARIWNLLLKINKCDIPDLTSQFYSYKGDGYINSTNSLALYRPSGICRRGVRGMAVSWNFRSRLSNVKPAIVHNNKAVPGIGKLERIDLVNALQASLTQCL
jgi:hypothetical protein